MKLYGTPPSHFTRKVRVVLQELGLPFEFIVLETLMETGVANFAQNPLHQIPVLEDGDQRVIESDLICEYLIDTYGAKNPSLTLFPRENLLQQKTRLAIINGAMNSGVKLIRARRSAISWDFPFFRQELATIHAALDWLDSDLGEKNAYEASRLTLLDVSLICFAEWAIFREMIPSLDKHKNIARFVGAHRSRPSFLATRPAVS